MVVAACDTGCELSPCVVMMGAVAADLQAAAAAGVEAGEAPRNGGRPGARGGLLASIIMSQGMPEAPYSICSWLCSLTVFAA